MSNTFLYGQNDDKINFVKIWHAMHQKNYGEGCLYGTVANMIDCNIVVNKLVL